MKKNLRLFCLGLATAAFTGAFAQTVTDYTSLLKNTDMEEGLKGWVFDGDRYLGKNTKDVFYRPGFYGMSGAVLEAWNSNANTGIPNGYIMQRVGEGKLPNGTYVFGAYVGASKQNHRKDVCVIEKDGDKETHVLVDGRHQIEYWSNRDSIVGVTLFANDAEVTVGTNNPDEWANFDEAHTGKFNVAFNLTENYGRPGYMTVGLRYEETNANYIVWDNPTLYYFGNMSEAEALDAMAKIDMLNVIDVADTLTRVVLNVDTLAALNAAIAEANKATITADNLWDESAKLFYQMGMARKSQTDYSTLKKNIESAEKLFDMEWSALTEEALGSSWAAMFLEGLPSILDEGRAAYANPTLNRAELTELRKKINWTAGDVKVDSVIDAMTRIEMYAAETEGLVGVNGGLSQDQHDALLALGAELGDTFNVYYAEIEAGLEMKDRKCDPNSLYSYIAKVNKAIKDVQDNPYSTGGTKMPLELKKGTDGFLEGSKEVNGLREYTSDLFKFDDKVSVFRITVHEGQQDKVYFTLSSLELFDGEGEEIELKEDMITSNACHNSLNSGTDGQGIPGLIDNNPETYFHSTWGAASSDGGAHYLEITLPNDGYNMFKFKMAARKGSNHQFPRSATLSINMPNRATLERTLAEAKGLNLYTNAEVGFYTYSFDYLLNAIAKVEAALEGYLSETQCATLNRELVSAIDEFQEDENKSIINLPEADKKYRLVSAYSEYYKNQFVEKAVTVHEGEIKSFWWGNLDAADATQEFMFEPYLDEEGEPYIEIEEYKEGEVTKYKTIYCYKLKNVGTDLYVDTFANNQLTLAQQTTDTIRLEWIARGQWYIKAGHTAIHPGDHGDGVASTAQGNYGGTKGVASSIVGYNGDWGIDGKTAWFIREYPALPCNVAVSGSLKSECIHFEAANTITLTANKDCSFSDLALYDLYGNAIEVEGVSVLGNKATVTLSKNIVGCAFAFTNSEKVTSVEFDAFVSDITKLQEAYAAAVAVAPIEGTDVMQYADLSDYNAALEAAEAMLGAGGSKEEIEDMVKRLEDVVAALKPNKPEAGKYYFIFCGDDSYEKNNGYRMGIRSVGTMLSWGAENELEWNRYWQFEPATAAELKACGVENTTDVEAYFIKNVSNGKYISAGEAQSNQLEVVAKTSATPYAVVSWGEGCKVAIKQVNKSGWCLHAQSWESQLVSWWDNTGVRSSWTISEAKYDVTDIDFAEIETEQAVVKGTYDLFGRRIVAPTAPGIYIIDGKKKYIKK